MPPELVFFKLIREIIRAKWDLRGQLKSLRLSSLIKLGHTSRHQTESDHLQVRKWRLGRNQPANPRLEVSRSMRKQIVFTCFKSSGLTKYPVVFCYSGVIIQRHKAWIHQYNDSAVSEIRPVVQGCKEWPGFKSKVDLGFVGTLGTFTR